MNKTKFFKVCDACDKRLAHQLRVDTCREYRGLDNIIELRGSTWCDGGLISQEIYRPLPGRQGKDYYQKANKQIEKILPKFRRWLKEWKVLRDIPAELTAAEEIAEAREYDRMMFDDTEDI